MLSAAINLFQKKKNHDTEFFAVLDIHVQKQRDDILSQCDHFIVQVFYEAVALV